jgi:hypothetical protein
MPQDKITIYGPKRDGAYTVEFTTAAGEAVAISVPAGETRVLQHFQARMPYGLVACMWPSLSTQGSARNAAR